MRYAVVIEKATENYSAYVPDLPGCVATGPTVESVEAPFERPSGSISKVWRRTGCLSRLPPALPNTSMPKRNRLGALQPEAMHRALPE